MTGGGAARRAVLRWALRLARRDWRQQLLVLVLLTVAVGAAVAGSAMALASNHDPAGQFGSGGARIQIDGTDGTRAQAAIAAARSRFGVIDVVAHDDVAVPGSVRHLDVRDQDPSGPYSHPMLALRTGRYPTAPGEAALTRGAADLLGASLGSTVAVGGRPAVVVGIVENPSALGERFVLVAPGRLTAPASYTVLVDPGGRGPGPADDAASVPLGLERGGADDGGATVLMLAASTMALSLVGLVAAAAFVVVAQRRQRQLGLLAAIGATDRHISLVMMANGAVVGLVAAAVGTAGGIGGWLLAAPAIELAADRRLDRLALPWGLIGAIAALAVGIAALAAWWPARTAARLSVTEALSGRPTPPRAIHRSVVLALVLLAAGIAGIYLAQPRSVHVQPLLLIAGLVAVVMGAVLAAPAAVRLLGRLARHLPFAPRLALRDLARYQARAAAALAAITLGLGIAVGVIGVAAAHAHEGGPANLSDRELLIGVGDPRTAPNPGLAADQRARLDEAAATVVAALGGDERAVPLDVVFGATTSRDPNVKEPVVAGLQSDPHTVGFVAYPYVATPELLARYGIDPASIAPTTDLLTGRDPNGLVLADFTVREVGEPAPPVVQRVPLPTFTSAPSVLVTEGAVARHGWVPARAGWIVEASRPLSGRAIHAAQAAAAAAGLTVEVRSTQSGLPAVRTGAVIAAAVLALAIIAIAVGLIRGESVRDVRTLTATGASPRTRRALTASTAAALAVVGVLLGTAAAYVALAAAFHSDLNQLRPVPLGQLVPLVLGLPIAATAVGWLLAGREPRAIARQALD